MKQKIIALLEKELSKKIEKQEIENSISIPPNPEMGDFSFPFFSLAKIERKSPLLIAENLAERLRKYLPKELSSVQAKAGYLNFFLNKTMLAQGTIEKILKEKEKFGNSNEFKGKTLVIDMSSPNIAKPFGIGHLRSTIIGNSLSEIHKKLGYKVTKINYLGDWGTQFGKLIVGYEKWGDEKKLKKEPIKHLLEIYVKANLEEYEEKARDEFKKLEDGNKKSLLLWKKFRELSLKEFNEIYKILGVKFDVISGESQYNDKMEKTIEELKSKSLIKESESAEIVDLEKYNLGVCLIKKSDGATLYATRDITAAIDRYKKYKFSRMIYEVGQEQKLHFQQIFKVLELMGYNFSKNCIHVSHGLYLDEEGKKFATRKGKTVFMKDILEETIYLAKITIEEKNSELKNKEEIARKIAIAAIFYGDLKNTRTNDMIFDIDKFLEFEGNTGPYLLYSYARANSILRKYNEESKKTKAKQKKEENKKLEKIEINPQEAELIKKLAEFPEIIKKSYTNLAPNIIANYSYELSQVFNEFYHAHPVLGSKEQLFRLNLVRSFCIVLKSALNLLGIQEVDEM